MATSFRGVGVGLSVTPTGVKKILFKHAQDTCALIAVSQQLIGK